MPDGKPNRPELAVKCVYLNSIKRTIGRFGSSHGIH